MIAAEIEAAGRLDEDARKLADFLHSHRRLVVLTGAGCSTESGIPDYRGPQGTLKTRQPMRFAEFVRSAESRRRYWARSFHGWPAMAAARPNPAHHAIAALERSGRMAGLITQNVDGLHGDAGSGQQVELHGRLREVICLACRQVSSREEFQNRLAEVNAVGSGAVEIAPDGDATITAESIECFIVPPCPRCGGVLKPHVVFFGEQVPRDRVDCATDWIAQAEGLLVVGSSLMVWSGYRFARAAGIRKLPIAIVNLGATRGDDLASLKIERTCGRVLPEALRILESERIENAPMA